VERLTGIPSAVANLDPALPAKTECDRCQSVLESGAALRVPLGQTRNLLDERARLTGILIAEEPAHPEPQHRLPGER
jgi:hypothetical protein